MPIGVSNLKVGEWIDLRPGDWGNPCEAIPSSFAADVVKSLHGVRELTVYRGERKGLTSEWKRQDGATQTVGRERTWTTPTQNGAQHVLN